MSNRRKLAELLRISTLELRHLSERNDQLYSEFDIPKKTGGVRNVENPHRQLKLVQARMARLLNRIEPPGYLFCPVKGRCYVTNAAQHRGQRVVHCLDIRKYYPSTPSRRVFWFFRTVMKCASDVAGILTRLATYREHLPTGSPLSPILAYFAFYDVWEAVAEICQRYGYRLTVYVDDVTISGQKLSVDALWQIKRAIHRSGLRYHKEKHYVDRPAEITGVIVDGLKLKPPHRQFKKLAAARNQLIRETNEFMANELKGRIDGLRGQLTQIRRVDVSATAEIKPMTDAAVSIL